MAQEAEAVNWGNTLDNIGLCGALRSTLPNSLRLDDVAFLCIGTNKVSGDSFGPLVGTKLLEAGYTNVVGTYENPAHLANVLERAKEIPEGKTIISIGSCIGTTRNTQGRFIVETGGFQAGAGVGSNVSPVGDYQVKGITLVDTSQIVLIRLMRLQSVPIDLPTRMAEAMVGAIELIFPLN